MGHDDSKNDSKNDNVDRMSIGNFFTVSGKNASKLYFAAGVMGIIVALGWALEKIIGALHGTGN